VPAVLAVLGEKVSWLPRRLDRILPHVDVEGEALSRLHAVGSPAHDEKTDTGTHAST
jgi:RND superfamily putative drug exporter